MAQPHLHSQVPQTTISSCKWITSTTSRIVTKQQWLSCLAWPAPLLDIILLYAEGQLCSQIFLPGTTALIKLICLIRLYCTSFHSAYAKQPKGSGSAPSSAFTHAGNLTEHSIWGNHILLAASFKHQVSLFISYAYSYWCCINNRHRERHQFPRASRTVFLWLTITHPYRTHLLSRYIKSTLDHGDNGGQNESWRTSQIIHPTGIPSCLLISQLLDNLWRVETCWWTIPARSRCKMDLIRVKQGGVGWICESSWRRRRFYKQRRKKILRPIRA